MQRLFKQSVALLVSLFVLLACDASEVISEEYFPNGTVKKRFSTLQEGDQSFIQYEHYNEIGQLIRKGINLGEVAHLEERYENEELVYYKEIQGDSLLKQTFDIEGDLSLKVKYSLSDSLGKRFTYYPGERVMYIDEVKADVQHGKSYYYLKNGMLKSESKFANGKPIDTTYWYNSHSELASITVYQSSCDKSDSLCTDTLSSQTIIIGE